MDSKPIYEILMLEKPITVDEFGWPHYGRSENVGFYFEQERAPNTVRNNVCNLNEHGRYKAAIVQRKGEGIYPLPNKEWYFIFDKVAEIYKEQKIPEGMQHFTIS